MTRIGYRQLAADRWAASPFYVVDVDREKLDEIYRDGRKLMVSLQRSPGAGAESIAVRRAEVEGGHAVSVNAVRLQLNTLTTIGLNGDSYWLDTGSILNFK